MKCPNCGNENQNDAKFCKSCGEPLKTNIIKVNANKDDNSKKIIIALVIIAALLLSGIVLYATGVIGLPIEYETQNFDGFTIDVPKDSKFVLGESYTTDKKNIFVSYMNKGEKTFDVFGFMVGTNVTKKIMKFDSEFVEDDGGLTVYKNESDGTTMYKVFKKGTDANIILLGDNLDVLKHMANSFKDKDFKKLATTEISPSTPSTSSSSSPQTTQTQNTAPTATALSILGGSFSTGSGLSDKTYASIYVGPEHAGENVKIQIWYSRDGSTLNNGNMVPKTVDSSGYINVRSADAYSKYPDYAEVNVYDTSGNLLDSVSVTLSPDSGTQSF